MMAVVLLRVSGEIETKRIAHSRRAENLLQSVFAAKPAAWW